MDNPAINSEKEMLGACVLDQNALDKAIIAGVSIAWFRDKLHALVWQNLCDAVREGIKIDLPWLVEMMGQQYAMRLSQMVADVFSTSNIMTHIEVMRKNYLRQQLAQQIRIMQSRMFKENPIGLINETIETLANLKTVNQVEDSTRDHRIADYLSREIEVSTGYSDLDYKTHGFAPATFWVIGGDTSHGKSTLLQNLAYNVVKRKHPATYISTEIRDELFFARLITMATGIKRGLHGLTEEELRVSMQKYDELKDLPLEFLYTTSLSHIRLVVQRRESKVYFIDHLQDIHPDQFIKNRREEMAYVVRALEEMSKEHKVCIVCTSKFARPHGGTTTPSVHSFKETGEIEYSADIAGLLLYQWAYRNAFSEDEQEEMERKGEPNTLRLSIVKNRIHGHTGQIKFYFDFKNMLITEMSKEEETPL